jgi:copper oxidase (laccase) domain-containing protein
MSSLEQIIPTLSVPVFGGKVSIHAFGCAGERNYSFREIDQSPDAYETHKDVFAALAAIPADCDFYAPSPVLMNAEIVEPDEIRAAPLAKRWAMKRSVAPFGDFFLHRGLAADGLACLDPQTGYAMSSADCALIVVECDGIIIATHAGRNSIVDVPAIQGEQPRRNESVVETIFNNYVCLAEAKQTHVWVGLSISPGSHFQHVRGNPRFPHNDRMIDTITKKYGKECFKDDGQGGALGWLDTKELIRRQFMHFGVPMENITLDSVCTYSDTDEDGRHLWHSNIRNNIHADKHGRNLVAVVVN